MTQAAAAPGPTRRVPRWLLVALFSSLAINLVFVGVVAGALWRFRHPGWPGGAAPVPLASHLQNLAARTYHLGIRPHRLSVDAAEAGALRLRGTVEFAEISGSETFLHVSLTELGAECVIHRAGTEPHLPGEDIEVFFQPDAVFAYFEDGRLAAAPEPRD